MIRKGVKRSMKAILRAIYRPGSGDRGKKAGKIKKEEG
jgi:hypothetical protein